MSFGDQNKIRSSENTVGKKAIDTQAHVLHTSCTSVFDKGTHMHVPL